MKAVREAVLTVKNILNDRKWNVKKIGLISVIFLMPMGPLALLIYFTAKHISKGEQCIETKVEQEKNT